MSKGNVWPFILAFIFAVVLYAVHDSSIQKAKTEQRLETLASIDTDEIYSDGYYDGYYDGYDKGWEAAEDVVDSWCDEDHWYYDWVYSLGMTEGYEMCLLEHDIAE